MRGVLGGFKNMFKQWHLNAKKNKQKKAPKKKKNIFLILLVPVTIILSAFSFNHKKTIVKSKNKVTKDNNKEKELHLKEQELENKEEELINREKALVDKEKSEVYKTEKKENKESSKDTKEEISVKSPSIVEKKDILLQEVKIKDRKKITKVHKRQPKFIENEDNQEIEDLSASILFLNEIITHEKIETKEITKEKVKITSAPILDDNYLDDTIKNYKQNFYEHQKKNIDKDIKENKKILKQYHNEQQSVSDKNEHTAAYLNYFMVKINRIRRLSNSMLRPTTLTNYITSIMLSNSLKSMRSITNKKNPNFNKYNIQSKHMMLSSTINIYQSALTDINLLQQEIINVLGYSASATALLSELHELENYLNSKIIEQQLQQSLSRGKTKILN